MKAFFVESNYTAAYQKFNAAYVITIAEFAMINTLFLSHRLEFIASILLNTTLQFISF